MKTNKTMIRVAGAMSLALMAGLAAAQDFSSNQTLSSSQKSQLDKALSDYMKNNKVEGMSLVVGRGGVILYSKGYGLAGITPPKPASGNTIFRLASVSKPVTALAAMSLVEDGKLDLSKQTRHYFGQLPNHHTHTLRQILSHMSGVRHYNNPEPAAIPNLNWTTMKAASGLIMGSPLLFAPGQQYSYSTHAFTLFGAALEGASGMTFKNLIQQRIANRHNVPTIRVEERNKPNGNRAGLFQVVGNKVVPVPADNTSWKAPGGGIEASGNDLCRLGMRVAMAQDIKPATLTAMFTKQKFNNGSEGSYGLGFRIGSHLGKTVVHHSGEQLGSQTHWRIYPQSKLVVVVLSNTRGHDPATLAATAAQIAGP